MPDYRRVGGRGIACVGGVNSAYPLLLASQCHKRPEWASIAVAGLDRIAAHRNPANDQEDVLAFIRGAMLLHEITGRDEWIEQLANAAEYEFLWRYMYNTRPDSEPLKSAGWHSCGGSITSVSNPHIHPMGLLIAGDLAYLHAHNGDAHVRARLYDSLIWTRNSIELFPGKTGYRRLGWSGERYCPSDGLLIAKYRDGTAASTELGLNQWAASAMLEGLIESATFASDGNGIRV